MAGCVIASRLKQDDPSISIIILEAGPNPTSKHDIVTPMGGFALQGSELDWQYNTEPVKETRDRAHKLTAGKTLGGGSVLNYGGWSRGDAADYDAWSRLTGYDEWSYGRLLPYFKRSERFDTADALPGLSQRGHHGPIKITSVGASSTKRKYPLGEPLRRAWVELGVKQEAYGCTGHNEGLSEWLENWDNGQRQPAHRVYPLDGVQVSTNTPVAKVLLTESVGMSANHQPKATGVLLQNGQTIQTHREVVICAGAIGSPTILIASGIGEASLLSQRHIPIVHDLPGVGSNVIDHFALFQLFKLRPCNKGLAMGHPDLEDPAFLLGLPSDYVVNEGLPRDLLQKALDEDRVSGVEREALLEPGRCFLELLVLYHPLSAPVPADGTYVSTSVMLTLPSSRGKVSIPRAGPPVIEPGYFATALDRSALIYGVRRMLQLMLATNAMQSFIEVEVPPPGFGPLHVDSSDADIEARIRGTGVAHCHTVGTCALGSVLNAEMCVHGIEGIRVCDASVLPSHVGGHPQATIYGVSEKAADCIAHSGDS